MNDDIDHPDVHGAGSAHRLSATRDSYDAIAAEYTSWIAEELNTKHYDRAVLAAFADLVRATGAPETLEIGCGPGRITAFLAALGLDAQGLDLSPAMVDQAKRLYPTLDFMIGSMTALPFEDASFGGVIAWYSIIHLPDDALNAAFAEVARVLRPEGCFQLAFQLGDRIDHADCLAGIDVDLDFHRRSLAVVSERLAHHGFTPLACVEREPDGAGRYPESTQQGYLLVRR